MTQRHDATLALTPTLTLTLILTLTLTLTLTFNPTLTLNLTLTHIRSSQSSAAMRPGLLSRDDVRP